MAKAPDYGSYIPDANDPVFVTQAKAAQLAKEQPLYASGQGTPIFNNPGGIDGYVQFNSASSFGGDVGFTYNNKTRSVNILGNLNVGGFLNSKFYTNFSNLRISGGSEGDVIFTDGEGNLSWGNLDNYTTNAELTARFTAFQQGNVNFTGANVSLGNVSNLHISGGSPNFILSTDGNGNLSWIEETGGGPNRFSIYNGTSNVAVPNTDGNVFVNVNDEYQWVYNTDGELLAGGQFVAKQGELTAGAGYTFDETSRDTGMYSDSDGQLKFKANDKLVAFYTDNDVHLYTKSDDYITTYDWHLDRTGNLTLPTGGAINYSNGVSILSGLGGGGDSFDQSLNTDDDVTFGTVSSTTVNVSQINGTNPGDELIVQANGLNWTFGTEGNLTLPSNTARINYANGTNILDGLGGDGTGLSVTDFGEGFSLTASNKIVTNKLYSTNETQPTQHYRLELDTNGVVVLPDGSIINGSTIRGVAGTGELNYTGITIGPNSGDAEKTWMWVDHANAYISTNNFVNTWTFDNNGNFRLPAGGDILDSTGNSVLVGTNLGNLSVEDNVIVSSDSEAYINFDADGGNNILALGTGDGATVQISTDDGATNFEFTASEGAGSIKFPDDTVQTTAYIGQEISPSVPRSDTAPVAANGQLWFNTLEGRMYIKYDGAWVDAAPLMTPAPELNPEFTSITFPDASVQTSAFPTKLVNGNREVVLNSNGSLLVAEDIILPQTGRIIKDCNNNGGTTSQRWVNIPTDTEVELIRAYTGDPDASGGLDVERAKISVEWQTPDKTGLSITAFDDGDEYKWEFNGDGTTQFPDGIIKAPPGDTTISMQSQNSKNFVTVSDGQVLITAENTTAYNWAFGTNGVLTLPLNSYLESSDNNLKVGAQGNVTIRSNAAGGAGLKAWTFGTDGNLTLPGNIRFPNGANIAVPSGTPRTNAIAITNATELLIGTNTATTSSLWTFGIDGSTIFPDNTVKGYCFTTTNTVTNYIPQSAQFLYTDSPILRLISTIGGTWYIKGPGLVGWKQITSVQDNGGVALIVRIGSGAGPLEDGSEFPAGGGNVYTISQYLEFDLTVADKTWMFDKDGNITLPTNTSAINYANGQSILDGLGGGSSYGNSNVANYLPTHTGNVTAGNLSATGNITGNYIIGNGSQLTGLPASYANADVATFLASYGSNTITTTGNVSANYFIGNGSQLTDITVSTATTAATVTTNAQPNITSVGTLSGLTVGPNSSIVLSGTSGYVKANSLQGTDGTQTIYLKYGSVAGAAGIATDLTVGTTGTGNLTANGTISASGNITGNYFIGNGSQLTGITTSYANANVATFLDSFGSNNISTSGNVSVGNLLLSGTAVGYGVIAPTIGSNTSPVTGAISATTTGTATTILTAAIPAAGIWEITAQVQGSLLSGQQGCFALFDGAGALVANTESKAGYIGSGTTFQGQGTSVWRVTTVGAVNYTVRGYGPGATGGFTVLNGSDGRTNVSWSLLSAPVTLDGMTVPTNISVVGNVDSANVLATGYMSAAGNITGNYILGNGSQLTGITASTAATVTTDAQPNITSVGTLSSLSVSGNITGGNLSTAGRVDSTGNIVTGGQIQSSAFTGGNISWSVNNQTDFQGAIKVGGTGIIKGPGGASSITLNNNGANIPIIGVTNTSNSTSTTTGALIVSGGAGIAGNVHVGGLVSATGTIDGGNLTTGGQVSATGNVTGANLITAGLLTVTGNITGGNIRTAGVMSSTGNLTSGNILTGGLLSATGNITGGNLITSGLLTVAGNISAGGNIIGASSNVSLVAGSYTWTFDNTSNAAFPGNLSATSNIRSNASFIATNVSGTISIGNTNSFMMGIGNANYYVQSYVHNQSNTSEASADMIVYGSSGTDNLGFMDMGMTSNNFSSSFFTVTGKSEGYMFMSGVPGTSGNMVIATNSTGSNNSIEFYVGGFSSVKGSNRPLLVSNTGISVTGNITGNTNGFAIGYRDVPQVAASNATIGLTDAGKHFYSTTAGNFTLTIPNNATTTFSTGTAISIVVQAAGNILVNAASGVTLYMAGNSTAANRVVGTYGMATIMKVASDTWFINGTGVS
jgi:hypothetical protein